MICKPYKQDLLTFILWLAGLLFPKDLPAIFITYIINEDENNCRQQGPLHKRDT